MDEHRARLDALTGTRIFAALAVFVFHAIGLGLIDERNTGLPLTYYARCLGPIGVEFFFVLSGFVLAWSAPAVIGYGRFVRRRLVKIYPNHLVGYLLALVVYAGFAVTWGIALANLVLINAWWPDKIMVGGVNPPSWSLSVELLAYLVFPLLLGAVRRIPGPRLWWACAGVLLAIWLMPVVADRLPDHTRAPYPGPLAGEKVTALWFVHLFPPVRLLDFLLGILVAQLVRQGRWPRIPVGLTVLFAAAWYGISLFLPPLYALTAAMAAPIALLIGSLAAGELRSGPGLAGGPVLRTLGEVSFAFYLLHYTVLVAVRLLTGGLDHPLTAGAGLLLLLGSLASTLALSFVVYHLVEKPAMRYFAGPRPAGGRVAPPASDRVGARSV
ncbi:acyltransferase [Pseudonocardiaceae bacterium YIM PH 21723]|nr:acyltransferase [Pseudonocardiaceae bacterium YIM PH 21723]